MSFTIAGFATLNVEGVNLSAGGAATINGKLDVAALEESITVTSQSPTIDLESSKVAVNWDQQKLDDIPYSPQLDGPGRTHSRPPPPRLTSAARASAPAPARRHAPSAAPAAASSATTA